MLLPNENNAIQGQTTERVYQGLLGPIYLSQASNQNITILSTLRSERISKVQALAQYKSFQESNMSRLSDMSARLSLIYKMIVNMAHEARLTNVELNRLFFNRGASFNASLMLEDLLCYKILSNTYWLGNYRNNLIFQRIELENSNLAERMSLLFRNLPTLLSPYFPFIDDIVYILAQSAEPITRNEITQVDEQVWGNEQQREDDLTMADDDSISIQMRMGG